MAKKISAYTEVTAQPANDDLLLLELASNGQYRKVKWQNLVDDTSITTAKLASGAVTQAKLSTTAGEIGASWATWTPTLTAITLGNGTLTAKYVQIGKVVTLRFNFVLGSTSAIGTNPKFTLPVTSLSYGASGTETIRVGGAMFEDTGVTNAHGIVGLISTTEAGFYVNSANGTYVGIAGISSTVPWTWGTGDSLNTTFSYEAA